MSEVVEVQLEWKYSPETYLEKSILIKEESLEISIQDGLAFAKIDPKFFAENPSIKEHLTGMIENRLVAVQLLSHKEYNLTKPSRIDIKKDGTKRYNLEVDPIAIKMTVGPVDFIVKNKDGNVTSDTRQDRLNRQDRISKTLNRHRNSDNTLDQMLRSYQAAVKDPKNELVYLYEIRDALKKRFKNAKNAKKYLNISKADWNIIGELANNQPLEEGRHRGQSVGALRPAEIHELETVRKAVSTIIEKYLVFLENQDQKA